jgi:chaperonin GroES
MINYGRKSIMLKPLADRVIVKFEEEKEEKTASGLLLTAKAAGNSYAFATVVACGAGKYASTGTLIPMAVKVGDKVLLSKTAGQKVKAEGEELTVVYESEIIAIAE